MLGEWICNRGQKQNKTERQKSKFSTFIFCYYFQFNCRPCIAYLQYDFPWTLAMISEIIYF